MWAWFWLRFSRRTRPEISRIETLAPRREAMEMATQARAIRIHEAIQPDWETVKEWAKATFTKERMTEVGLAATTLLMTGYLGSVLCK